MKKITLFILLLSISFLSAQTTFEVDWQLNIGSGASLTIETGDTVIWIWGDNAPHSVSTLPGSTETFDSGVLSGLNTLYDHTFTQVGTNPYQCNVHPNAMNGTIIVEMALSVDDKFLRNIKFYPNPVTEQMTIFSLYKLDNYRIFNVIGALVTEGKGNGSNTTLLNLSKLNSGFYFVTVRSGNLQSTFKITKI